MSEFIIRLQRVNFNCRNFAGQTAGEGVTKVVKNVLFSLLFGIHSMYVITCMGDGIPRQKISLL